MRELNDDDEVSGTQVEDNEGKIPVEGNDLADREPEWTSFDVADEALDIFGVFEL